MTPVLVRLKARPCTAGELQAELAVLARRYAAVDDVRPDWYQRFVDKLPALTAGFTPGASPKARISAIRWLDWFTWRLEDALGANAGGRAGLPEVESTAPAPALRRRVPAGISAAYRLWCVGGGIGVLVSVSGFLGNVAYFLQDEEDPDVVDLDLE